MKRRKKETDLRPHTVGIRLSDREKSMMLDLAKKNRRTHGDLMRLLLLEEYDRTVGKTEEEES